MMLSMGTFPMSPVKNSSSVMLELISRSAGRRTRIRASLRGKAGALETHPAVQNTGAKELDLPLLPP